MEGRKPDFFSRQVTESRCYYFHVSDRSHASFDVICGGLERCRYDYVIDRKDFPYHAIEFVSEGNGELMVGGNSYALSPGTVFSYGPGIPHVIRSDPDNVLIKYFVDFAGDGAIRLMKAISMEKGGAAHVSNPQIISGIFEQLQNSGISRGANSGRISELLLETLVLLIQETKFSGHQTANFAAATYHRCREHVGRHFNLLKTLDDISGSCGIDKAYLCRLFKKFGGTSPYSYLMKLKMNSAAVRLKTSDFTLKNIAFENGFKDPYHFSKTFKKVYGVSPDAFRKGV
jgi:AraC-like DNA-binding protein